MSIRTRIFRSYLTLIIIVLVYLALSILFSSFRLRMERDKNEILGVKTLWGEMLVFMNETVSNWNDGETYENFHANSLKFDQRIGELTAEKGRGAWYRREINRHLGNLYGVWKMARVNVERIGETRWSTEFLRVEEYLVQEPGLQRLYHVYMRFIAEGGDAQTLHAFALKEYIDAIEFFPIYSDTVNYLFAVILDGMERQYDRLLGIQNYLSILFFLIFLISFVLISSHFTDSLSLPITRLSIKLNSFIGKSVEPRSNEGSDELAMLATSVDDLINHYTHLSELARRLSRGHIETSLLTLPRQGLVGNAMKEVAAYMKELARVADWIREGRYGAVVEEKSDQDVLARSFNIMSREIAEKITTLTNIFETIDEGILLIDDEGTIMEANQRFLSLVGVEDLRQVESQDLLFRVAGGDEEIRERLFCGEAVSDLFSEVLNLQGDKIPVKLNVRPLANADGDRGGILLLISNESLRVRMRREQEKLAAQAVEAELRALRAQINPHFFFNTLNTIAHLIETDSAAAVGVVEKLAGLFRYTLESTKRQRVALREEIHHIDEFLAIERIRHGARLTVGFNVETGAEEREIPPMLLQPIVENSIKYGADGEGMIVIGIGARLEGDELVMEVTDSGREVIDIGGLIDNSRTGLRNVNQRLETLYRTRLLFEQPAKGGLLVRIRIPDEGAGK